MRSRMAIPDDQRDVIDFLSRPSSYGAAVERVDIVETHVSQVFLAGDRAYKLKRAIKFPYLDFSTAEQRRIACQAELALNRRTAPDLYLEVRALTRTANSAIGFGTEGRVVDWVVVMRRFDQAALFDELAKTNRLNASLMTELAEHIAAFHQAAEPRPDHGGAAALAAIVDTNHCCLIAAPHAGFLTEDIVEIRLRSSERLAAIGALLDGRCASGKVRRCHGDLHLRNVCLFEGRPTLFDCLEFSDELASVDVLYDLAFLLMDLEHREFADFSNLVLNRYLDLTGEDDGLAAMPLFLSSRAAIRAHVTAAAMERAAQPNLSLEMAAEARSYLELAARFLRPRSCRLVVIGGLSGTGKSTLAAALAPRLDARVLRSDVIRKRLFEVAPETRLPTSAYTAQVSRRVYQTLRREAANALAAGYSVIVDAVSLKPSERQSFVTVAEAAGVPFAGIWLEAPPATMDRRLRARRYDASDASPEVLAQQLQQDPGTVEWVRIEAGGDPEGCLSAARRSLGLS
jgi:uncharacterized protein